MREIIPIYNQIAHQLREKILQGVFSAGEQLPTETNLAQQFRVNRHTIRQAIGLLKNEGWIRVERGRGTFVAARTIRYPIGKRVRYTQTLKAQGWQAQFELLRILEISADIAISKGLEIGFGERVALVERLGFANDQPISVCSGYFPLKRFPDFFEPSHLQILETEKSISRFLYQVYGCDHIRRSTAVSARLVQPQDAILLQLSDNQPILLAESVNVDQSGNVIEYGVTRFRGDRMELFFQNDLTQYH
ncbi:phosphonate metabolism transcriptional regulator PhnF [Cylindrospermopsis raciborskii Cr2010]|uniref:phosphonate metabolism transcriptional regulator PhnF n=1 Tax=Cylindrospermopsis raciborskii TaxID=77022 RepID=UPI001F468DE1|nr:phosphonate metabolism transcriptional regulator PhnF [Cylindrospermopsis raciborskii]UJL34228.1 phosphonate metabolism transcriptional regulator PhnF [Cylindrospermopsis raciborskii Cr2010]UJS03752.1 phosphonate metabolism transcriptional regulator PhnF [Cylindrospermopsis raciborskii KLL07]